MIVASFDKNNRSAAVSGAYQYDTGQRLAMHGLPSPSELAVEDDLLSSDLVTVQAQFSYKGDSQARTALAQWDEERKVWLVSVPNDYLTRNRDVHVYVYVYYGTDEVGERAETAYEATFRPISRPAPDNVVTEGQLAQWAQVKEEIEISLSKVEAAVNNAQGAADSLNEAANATKNAAKSATDAAGAANTAKSNLETTGKNTITQGAVSNLSAGSAATASIVGGRLTIGAPKGATGATGETGPTGPSDVSLSFDSSTGTLTITTK